MDYAEDLVQFKSYAEGSQEATAGFGNMRVKFHINVKSIRKYIRGTRARRMPNVITQSGLHITALNRSLVIAAGYWSRENETNRKRSVRMDINKPTMPPVKRIARRRRIHVWTRGID